MYETQPGKENPPLKRFSGGLYFRTGFIPTFNKGEIYLAYRRGLNNIEYEDTNVDETTKTGITTLGVIVYIK